MLAYKMRNNSQIHETELNNSEIIEENVIDKNTYHGSYEELLKQEIEEIETMDKKLEGKDDE